MSICRPSCLLGLISVIFTAPVAAQILPDSSVGTTVIRNVEIKGATSEVIDGGRIRGANLFHSFSEFNMQNGGAAYFTNPEGITNIFSIITGNNHQ
jgi:large exoprotein involved in heme utilization and adhesion